MKKQMLVIWTAIIVVLLSVGSIAAQDGKKIKLETSNYPNLSAELLHPLTVEKFA